MPPSSSCFREIGASTSSSNRLPEESGASQQSPPTSDGRAVIVKVYAWKGAEWLRDVELLPEQRPGFWEGYSYSASAGAWREERFAA